MATLKTRITSSVDRAFAKIDSLLSDVTFTSVTEDGFDFGLNEPITTSATSTVRGFVEDKIKKVDGVAVTVTTLIIKKVDGLEINGFSKVTINSIDYNFKLAASNDFIITLELVRV